MAKNGASQEYIGPLIPEKIQIYILTRAELLYTLCHEIPCKTTLLTAYLRTSKSNQHSHTDLWKSETSRDIKKSF